MSSLRNKHELKWLRVTFVNKRHTNLKQMLLGDLKMKVMADIEDATTKTLPCNCPKSFLHWKEKEGKKEYSYGGDLQCKTAGMIYKLRCKCCNKFYIGMTQRYLKQRPEEHIQEVMGLYQQQISFN